MSETNQKLRSYEKQLRTLGSPKHTKKYAALYQEYLKLKYPNRVFDFTKKRYNPDFIIVGSYKCGTSSLYKFLCSHQSVYDRFPKELHFFTNYFDEGMEFYRSFFAEKPKDMLVGEASPSYFDKFAEKAHKKIAKHCPNTKLFLLLRNPVERTISAYYHQLRISKHANLGENFVNEDEILSVEILNSPLGKRILSGGKYMKKIRGWLNRNNDNLKIIKTEDLNNNTSVVLNECLDFLGLDKFDVEKIEGMKNANVNNYPKPSNEVVDFLNNHFQNHNAAFYNETGIKF